MDWSFLCQFLFHSSYKTIMCMTMSWQVELRNSTILFVSLWRNWGFKVSIYVSTVFFLCFNLLYTMCELLDKVKLVSSR